MKNKTSKIKQPKQPKQDCLKKNVKKGITPGKAKRRP